jgi:predicted RNA binding protein YcfA (HicA-like mRNA interferase family)
MKRFINRTYYRIGNAIKLAWWAFLHPENLNQNTFQMLSDLMILILKVANENRHYMSHIAYVHPDEGEKQIVSIWAGAGLGAEPTKRISELISENNILKEKLANYIADKTQQP